VTYILKFLFWKRYRFFRS